MISSYDIIRIGLYLFYRKKVTAQFTTREKMIGHHTCLREKDDLPSWRAPLSPGHREKGAIFNLRALATRKIMRSMDAQWNRTIFNWVSKVIRDCIGFNFTTLCDWSRKLATWSLAFSRAWGLLPVFTLSSHWLPLKFSFVLIGHYDYFVFGFTTLNRKALY